MFTRLKPSLPQSENKTKANISREDTGSVVYLTGSRYVACVTQCCFVFNRGGTGNFVESRYFECPGTLLLNEIICG